MKKIFTLFAAVLMAVSAMASWSEPVTLSKSTISSIADLEGIVITFTNATSLQCLNEDADIIALQNNDGSKMYAVWSPGYDGTYTIDGNSVTLKNWYDNTAGVALPETAQTLYFEDYGTFKINGTSGGFETTEIAYNPGSVTPDPEPEPTPLTVTLNVAEDNSKLNITVDNQTLPYAVAVYPAADYAEYSAIYNDLKLIQLFIQNTMGKTVLQGNQEITVADVKEMGLLTEPGTYQILACGLTEDFDQNGDIAKATITIAEPEPAFTFTDGEDGIVTVTPSDNDKHYVVILYNEDLLEKMSVYEPCTEEMLIAYYISSMHSELDNPEDVILSGVNGVDINDFAAYQQQILYVTLTTGTYTMVVVEVEKKGSFWKQAEGIGRHEGVSYTYELPDFVGTVVLGETGISVTGIGTEDYYVCYMLDKASYDEFSAGYSDDEIMTYTVGTSLPDETFTLYHALGDVVLYAEQDYFLDEELGGAGEYVVFVANVDMMTGTIGSHAVSYAVTLDAEGKKVSKPTAIDNVEAAKAVKFIENGHVVIIREGVRYNALGAQL